MVSLSYSDPTTYQMLNDALWPLKLMGAIVCAYLVHECIRDWIEERKDPFDGEDPDGFA